MWQLFLCDQSYRASGSLIAICIRDVPEYLDENPAELYTAAPWG